MHHYYIYIDQLKYHGDGRFTMTFDQARCVGIFKFDLPIEVKGKTKTVTFDLTGVCLYTSRDGKYTLEFLE